MGVEVGNLGNEALFVVWEGAVALESEGTTKATKGRGGHLDGVPGVSPAVASGVVCLLAGTLPSGNPGKARWAGVGTMGRRQISRMGPADVILYSLFWDTPLFLS